MYMFLDHNGFATTTFYMIGMIMEPVWNSRIVDKYVIKKIDGCAIFSWNHN